MYSPCFHLFVSFIESCPKEDIVICSKHLFRKMGYLVDAEEALNNGYMMSFLDQDHSCFKVICPPDDIVSLRMVRNFAGEIAGLKLKKGIVITPYVYSRQAVRYAEILGDGMELIDGMELADLCLKYDIFTE